MKNTNSSGFSQKNYRERSGETYKSQAVLKMVITAIIGLLLPHATVYGNYSPFGIGLIAAVSGPASIPVFLTTVLGYLLKGGAGSLRYMASLITVIGLRWSVSGFKQVTRSAWFAPIVSFISTLITGSALLLTVNRTLSDVLLILSESILAAGFAYFSSTVVGHTTFTLETECREKAIFSYVLVLSTVLMALYAFEWEGISLGRIVATTCILAVSSAGGVMGGSISGCILGLTVLLADPAHANLIAIYAFGGLLSGIFSKGNRWISVFVFSLTYLVIVSATQTGIDVSFFTGLYELAAASLFVIFLPPSIQKKIKKLFFKKTLPTANTAVKLMVSERMGSAARALSGVAETVDKVSKQLSTISEPDIGSVYRSVSCTVCASCKSRFACWEEQFEQTMDAFNQLTPTLSRGGEVSKSDIPEPFKNHCPHIKDLCEQINNSYTDFLVRENAFQRLHELRKIITDQFENSALMLHELSQRFATSEWLDENSTEELGKHLIGKNYPLKSVHCRILTDGRMNVLLCLRNQPIPGDIPDLLSEIEHICDRSFTLSGVERAIDETQLLFMEGVVFSTCIGTAQIKCKGEKLCGDAYEIFKDNNGRQYVVLSDGMGCGGRAAVDGAMTAGLTAQLVKAGFGYESILRMVNTALLAKSEDETLATLDMACIDLYRGDLELLKAGAGVSLLLSKGRVSRMEDSSLPLGILRELTFARTRDRLLEGDVLLIMSDGISNDGIKWVEDMLRLYDTDKDSVQALANRIAETASRLHKDEKGDDMTVIAIQILREK